MSAGGGSFTGRVLAEMASHPPTLTCCQAALVEGMALAVGVSRPADGVEELLTTRLVGVRSGLAALHALRRPARVERREVARRHRFALLAGDLRTVRGSARMCCRRTHLRGAFLAAGGLNRPEAAPSAEILAATAEGAERLAATARRLGLGGTAAVRRGRHVLIIRGADPVARLLTTLGAQNARLAFEQGRVMGEMRAEINRRTNAETANLRRTVTAALGQLDRIAALRDSGSAWRRLPPALVEAADLRVRHPEDTLERLAQRAGCSRSAMSGRLRRLIALAESGAS